MIDLHSHLLPGVDDGSATLEASAAVLARMWEEGTQVLACTPHLDASRAAVAPLERNAALLRDVQRVAPPGMRILSGFEIMLDEPGRDLTRPGLQLGESTAVLVEFPRQPLAPGWTAELMRIRASGMTPVVAHPERYSGITIDRLHEWRQLGAIMQGDALLLLSAGKKAEFSRRMLEEGVADILASDNHGDRRSLGVVRAWLREVGGDRQADILLSRNPARVLANEAMEPVPPLREQRSMWDRLRELYDKARTSIKI